MLDISVIIPAFNAARTIGVAIESAALESTRPKSSLWTTDRWTARPRWRGHSLA